MSRYIDLNRIEFVITDACSGRCKHCSNGKRLDIGGSVNADAAVTSIKRLAERFAIKSVMTFGGEPLLFSDTVCKIHAVACDCGIPKRQLITNGFFSKDGHKIDEVAKALCDAGVNDVLLSVDVFHQEFIPLEPVEQFADDVLNIVDGYDPYQNPVWRTVLEGGVSDLLRYAESESVAADISDCRSACGVCRKVMTAMKERKV